MNEDNVIHDYTTYEKGIKERSTMRYFLGLIARWKQHFKYAKARRIAIRNGATLGEGVIMPISLARKANKNLTVGNHVSIQTDKIDMRSPVTIGNHVIIGYGTEIITTSHNIDSPLWEHKYYGIKIGDYAWIPTKVLILPSCRTIGRGAVIGSGSIVVKNVEPRSVVSGNPAKEFKKWEYVHNQLVVEGLLGDDYGLYKLARNGKLTGKGRGTQKTN